MSLSETEKKIYQKNDPDPVPSGSFRQAGESKGIENPFSSESIRPDLEKRKDVWMKEEDEKREKRNKLIKRAGIIFAILIGIFAVVWVSLFIRKGSFSEDKVKVLLSGPDRVQSGEDATFEISYDNLNIASLKDAVIYVNYSENFKPSGNLQFESEGPRTSKFNVGTVSGKKNGKVSFRGKFFGPREKLAYMDVRIEYRASTFNSRFSAKANVSTLIASSPLLLEISGPQNVAAGNAASFTVSYQNSGQEEFRDLKIKADFPDGFSFSNSDPIPSQGNDLWYVGSLSAGQKGELKISGSLSGEMNEEKTMKVSIGEFGTENDFISYGAVETRMKIVGSPIVINETINGKKENVFVNAGEILNFNIKYKNTGTIGLREVILTVEANSSVLDYNRLDMRDFKGSFDSTKGLITWKTSDVPDFNVLAPNQEGEVNFSVPVKEIIPMTGQKDKNHSFSVVARMDSPDIPTPEGANKVIASNVVPVKLNSKLSARLEGFFNDADISNSGPLPLRAGAETTFSMRLKLANVSNDVTDAKVVVTLAPGVRWKNNFLPQNASVNYNDRTNEIIWNLGNLPAGIGIITDPRELVFQLGITPSPNQIGDFAPLVNKTIFSAKDSFTGQSLETKLDVKTTDLREDLSVGEGGKVGS